MTNRICMACGRRPSITITSDGWTPMCGPCSGRLGTPIAVGGRAVCHVGSIHGTVVGFDDESWAESGLAELAHEDGSTGWYPLAELTEAR